MPVSAYAVRMLWDDGEQAISETYLWSSVADDAKTVVYPAALELMKLRSLLMGAGVQAVSFRISKIGTFRYYINSDPRDVQTIPVGAGVINTNQPPAVLAAGGSNKQDGSADQANACILMDAYNTPQSHARKFLGGVPDVLVRTNPLGPWIVGVPAWGAAFDNYARLLAAGTTQWAFKARTLPNAAPWIPVKVQRYVTDPQSGLFGVQVPTFVAPIAVGEYLQLRLFRMNNKAYKAPNGNWQIDSIAAGIDAGTSVYYLRGTQGVAGTQIFTKGTAQGVDYTAYRFVTCQLAKDTTHKRGNRALASPGRRTKPARVSA